jgi:hypothetical protein
MSSDTRERLTGGEAGDSVTQSPVVSEVRRFRVGKANNAIPKDATKVTDQQRDVEEKLEHQNDDPEAPGRHQSRDQVADET